MRSVGAASTACLVGAFAMACGGGGAGSSPAGSTSGGGASSGSGGAVVGTGGGAGASGAASSSGGGVGSPGGTAGMLGSGGVTGGGAAGGVGAGGAGTPPDYSHTMDAITIAAGDEMTGTCQSWTLNNDAPVWVNRVVENNAGAFHHSNWIWVADTSYPGPDGTWKCADRGFDQIAAGALGGVFFAQSTQAVADTQGFPPGVAFLVPAHSRIIGDVHLLNVTDQPITTSLHFDVYATPAADVRVPLQPMAYTNLNLDIAPQGKTHAHMQCPTPVLPEYDVYYVLPHYHVLGQGMQIVVADGPMAGTSLLQSAGGFGEAQGRSFDPPIAVKGATALGISCDYDNPRSSSVHYGVGDQEMCVALIYTSGQKFGAQTFSILSTTDTGGVHTTDGWCLGI